MNFRGISLAFGKIGREFEVYCLLSATVYKSLVIVVVSLHADGCSTLVLVHVCTQRANDAIGMVTAPMINDEMNL